MEAGLCPLIPTPLNRDFCPHVCAVLRGENNDCLRAKVQKILESTFFGRGPISWGRELSQMGGELGAEKKGRKQ